MRGDESIRGINEDGEEIKLEIFADDLTGFVRNEQSFKVTDRFHGCLSGNLAYARSFRRNHGKLYIIAKLIN